MTSLTRAPLFSAGISPFICRQLSSLSLSIKATHQNSSLSTTQRSTVSTELTPSSTITAPVSTLAIDSGNGSSRSHNEVQKFTEAVEDDDVVCGNLSDYFEQAKVLNKSIGGSLRWFSPVECGREESRVKDAPLLLYLPENKGEEVREVSRWPKLAVHLADIDDNVQHFGIYYERIDGSGLGLFRHHRRLGKIFDVWCLHIPVADRTCFTGMVKFVESTVRLEHGHLPNRPIYLVGESLGSCLALAVAARNPNIDFVLILANPATSFSKSQMQLLVPALEFFPTQPFLSIPYLQSLIRGDQMNIFRHALEHGNVPEQTGRGLSLSLLALSSYFLVIDEILPRDTFLWRIYLLKTAAAYVNSRLHAVKSQTLILSSGRDPLFPSQEEGERLRSLLPNCELRNFNDSSHFLFLEDGVDLVYIIKAASFYRRGKCHDYVADYFPPTPSDCKNAIGQFGWMETAFSPVMLSTLENGEIVRGLGGIPSEGPVLIVGYHMLMGFELVPLVGKIFRERNILVRGMAHPIMFFRSKGGKLPDLSTYDFFRAMGATPVSGKNLLKLLSSKSHVLLYPGGVREALHRKGEEYKLMWPDQPEFVRMAARFGATIIPFGAVGEDDIGQLVVDYNDLMRIPYLKSQIEELTDESLKLRTSTSGKVANQDVHLPGILPKVPGRLYLLFGKPIQTQGRKEELKDKEKAQELYLHVKSEVEQCLDYLKEKREHDPYRSILARALYQATKGSTSEIPTFEL